MRATRGSQRFSRFVLLTALSAAFSCGLWAQEATGRIIGVVYDPTGAVIPDAHVVVTNTATHISRETKTDASGSYQVLALPVGEYTVAVDHKGFSSVKTSPNTLEINQSLKIDIRLAVGSTTETLTVETTGNLIETVNPTMGSTISTNAVQDLPLNGRNLLDLALLQPGVAPADNPGNGGARSANTAFSVSGGRNDSTTFLLDGGLNNNLLSNGVVYNPNPDTIQEFKIITSNFEAEYGRNAGGVVTVVTKSGTNSFHGSAFEFNRNDAYNANSYFNNANGKQRNVLRRNQYGGTFGGPIFKDKLFFFAGYQGQRENAVQSSLSVTPFTPAEIQGDFSHSRGQKNVVCFLNGLPQPAVPPGQATNSCQGATSPRPSHPFFQSDPALAAQGIINPATIDPIAKAYIAAGLIPVGPGPQIFQNLQQDNRDEITGKFDWHPTEKNTFSVLLGRSQNPTLIPANVPGFSTTTVNHRQFANIAYTRILSSTMLNEFRMTVQRNDNLQAVPAFTKPKPNDLGIQITSDNPTGPTRLTLGSGLTIGFSVQGPTSLIDNTFTYADTFTWTHNKHTMKFGGSFSAYQNNTLFDFFINGSLGFSTRNGARDTRANFLLGLPRSYTQFPAAPSNIRSKSTYIFGEDEWRLASNLTLSLGLRYEYSTPKLDTEGRSFSIVPGMHSTVFPNAPVGLVFPGDPGVPKGANFPDKNDFAPRFGFAWQPFRNANTSIRGGFGVFYDVLKGEDNLQFNGQPPFFAFASFTYPSAVGAGPYTFMTNPFTSTGNPNPFPSRPPDHNVNITSAFGAFGDAGVFFVDPNLRTPYTYQYNLSIQQELPAKMMLQTAYVGSTSHKLTALADVNPFDPATIRSATPHRILNETAGNTDNSFSFLEEFRNAANANYNSLQVSLRRDSPRSIRYLGSVYFTLAYTYSHGIDGASGFRNFTSTVPTFAPGFFRASSDFDLRHVFAFSGGWDLPFSRGPKRLVKGWSLYPIISYRTGYPLTVFADLSTSAVDPGPSGAGDSGLVNANLIGPVQYFDPHQKQTFVGNTGAFFFNPTSFSNASPTPPYGTAPRSILRGPSRTNMDLALAKITPVYGERVSIELRAEAFNLFNHTQFKSPDTNPDDTAFGQVTTTYDPRILQLGARIRF